MVIGVAGTAKNTGKTTTLCTLIGEAQKRNRLPGITGIGYDGEERDTVTLLPKPRIAVYPGMLVTTSEHCLQSSTARLHVLQRTGITTALGEIIVTRVDDSGLVVVAGPNKTDDLHEVIRVMNSLGVEDLLVDGSLNRIAPMALVDRVVFATGGARSTSLSALAEETSMIDRVFRYERHEKNLAGIEGIRLQGEEVAVQCASSSWHTTADVVRAMNWLPESLREIVFPGMITLDGLSVVADSVAHQKKGGMTLVFDNPFRLLLAGDTLQVGRILKRLGDLGVQINYRRTSVLVAITFNPYYPAFDGTTYHSAYVDAAAGRAALAAALKTPVIDVMEEGGDRLYEMCFESRVQE
jgi:hypothetical protein